MRERLFCFVLFCFFFYIDAIKTELQRETLTNIYASSMALPRSISNLESPSQIKAEHSMSFLFDDQIWMMSFKNISMAMNDQINHSFLLFCIFCQLTRCTRNWPIRVRVFFHSKEWKNNQNQSNCIWKMSVESNAWDCNRATMFTPDLSYGNQNRVCGLIATPAKSKQQRYQWNYWTPSKNEQAIGLEQKKIIKINELKML